MLNVFTTKKFFVLFSSSLLLIHVGIFYNNYVQHFVRWAIIIWAGKHTDVQLKFWGSEWTCLLLVVNLDWKFETVNLLASFQLRRSRRHDPGPSWVVIFLAFNKRFMWNCSSSFFPTVVKKMSKEEDHNRKQAFFKFFCNDLRLFHFV